MQSVPVSIQCNQVASAWYFLCRDVAILHEDVNAKVLGKLLCSGLFGLAALNNTNMTVEKIRRHALSVEKQLDAIALLINSINADGAHLINQLNLAQSSVYQDLPSIPVELPSGLTDMTLAMFVRHLKGSSSTNIPGEIAMAYETVCFHAYRIHHKDNPKRSYYEAVDKKMDQFATKHPNLFTAAVFNPIGGLLILSAVTGSLVADRMRGVE